MIGITQSGSFKNLEKFLANNKRKNIRNTLHKYGRQGVHALSSATPVDSGETANSWYYDIVESNGNLKIVWNNSHMAGNVPVAVLLQYGHATGSGAFIQGRDFINPALRKTFDQLADEVWREVVR